MSTSRHPECSRLSIYVIRSDHLVEQNITSLLDEQMTQKEVEELQEAEAVTRRFCALNLGESASLRLRLTEVLGRPSS